MKTIFRYLFMLFLLGAQNLPAMENEAPPKASAYASAKWEESERDGAESESAITTIKPAKAYLILTDINEIDADHIWGTFTLFDPGTNKLHIKQKINVLFPNPCPFIVTVKMVTMLYREDYASIGICSNRNYTAFQNTIRQILHRIRNRKRGYKNHSWINYQIYTQKALICAQAEYDRIISENPILSAHITQDIDDVIFKPDEEQAYQQPGTEETSAKAIATQETHFSVYNPMNPVLVIPSDDESDGVLGMGDLTETTARQKDSTEQTVLEKIIAARTSDGEPPYKRRRVDASWANYSDVP